MSKLFRRRSVAAIAAAALSLTVGAGPAMAHFCLKDFGSAAGTAANGNAWHTGEEMLAFATQAGCDNLAGIEAFIDAHEGYLFMGPGLLAAGTLQNGKGKTPKKITYMPFALFEGCD